MTFPRTARLATVVAIGAVALTACGTNNNTPASTAGGTGPTSSGSVASGASPAADAVLCASGTLTAAGSTAQANAISLWTQKYQQACSQATINYGGGGSGAGVQQFSDGKVDFAGSDFALKPGAQQQAADARCASGAAINLPMVAGAIVVGYNLPGITTLKLSSPTVAKIFAGTITHWNDPEITAQNSGVALPNLGIQTFHRSDGSGTTYNFTNYLNNLGKGAWTSAANKDWKGPGGQGAKGNQGVTQGITSTTGGIGYIELSFAQQNNVAMAQITNASGSYVAVSNQAAITFLSKAQVVGTAPDVTLKFDYASTEPSVYPAVLVTYEIVCAQGNPADKLPLLKGFLGYASSPRGQGLLQDAGYLPLPENLRADIATAVGNLG